MKAITKLKLRRLWNGLLGILIILSFATVDFLISASPCLIIKPVNMFQNLVCLALFVVLFIGILVLTVFVLAKKVEQTIPFEDEGN
jgi:hypothetical protein